MLRWGVLFLLLANALLLFWYAQQSQPVNPETEMAVGPGLVLLSELNGTSRSLQRRDRGCVVYSPLDNANEARRLAKRLEGDGITTRISTLPDEVAGYQLRLPLPADSSARVEMLDMLAKLGWLPQMVGGRLVLGTYRSEAEVDAARDRFPSVLRPRLQVVRKMQASDRYQVEVVYLIGYEIPKEINRVVRNSWPGIKIEKNVCEGVATPHNDQ